MLPSTSTRQHVIFDGTNKSYSFLDFVRQLENSPDWINPTTSSLSKGIEHVIPTHLYGEALRFYETLDLDCQQDWSQLRGVMARRFPRTIRNGGLVRRSTTEWDEDGLPTLAVTPPISSSRLAVPVPVIEEQVEDTASDPQEDVRKQRGTSLSLSVLKERLRVPSFSRTPSRPSTPREPYVAVHSMFIGYAHGGTKLRPMYTSTLVTVDLSDPQAVAAAKKAPLLTLPSNDDGERYLVGYTYTVLREERSIDFYHKVLAPRKSKIDYFQQTGEQTVSPTRQQSQAYSITEFIYNHDSPYSHRRKCPPGMYTIRSHLTSRKSKTYPDNEREELGEITWIVEVA